MNDPFFFKNRSFIYERFVLFKRTDRSFMNVEKKGQFFDEWIALFWTENEWIILFQTDHSFMNDPFFFKNESLIF